MVCRHSAQLGLLSALGALGRRFESCRPDSKKTSHNREFPKLSFLLSNIRYLRLSDYIAIIYIALLYFSLISYNKKKKFN